MPVTAVEPAGNPGPDWIERQWRVLISRQVRLLLLAGLGVAAAADLFMNTVEGPWLSFSINLGVLLLGLHGLAVLVQYAPITLRLVRGLPTRLAEAAWSAAPLRRRMEPAPGLALEAVNTALAGAGFRVRTSVGEGVTWLYAERGAWSLAGSLVGALGFVVGCAAVLSIRLTSFEGAIELSSGGGASGAVRITEPDGLVVTRPLIDEQGKRFSIRCDDFTFERSVDGAPRFSSVLVALSGAGNELSRGRVGKDAPFEFAGLTFHQAGYRERKDDARAIVTITDQQTGERKTVRASPATPFSIGTRGVAFRVVNYDPSFGELGPAIEIERAEEVEGADSKTTTFWVFSKYAEFDQEFRGDRYGLKFEKLDPAYVTGIRVVGSPGRFGVYLGGALLALGAVLFLSTTWRRIWVRFDGAQVEFAGAASRKPAAFATEFEQLLGKLGAAASASGGQDGST